MRKVHFRLFLSFSRSEKDRSNFSPAFAPQKGQTFLGTLFWVGKVLEKFAEPGRENNGKMMRMAAVFVTLFSSFSRAENSNMHAVCSLVPRRHSAIGIPNLGLGIGSECSFLATPIQSPKPRDSSTTSGVFCLDGGVTVELSRGRDFDLNEEGACERGLCGHCTHGPNF